MQKITPFLWFEKDMKAVTDFYLSVFPGSTTSYAGSLSDTPSGHVDMATLSLYGKDLSLMTAGPYLPFNPTVSFTVSCESEDEVRALHEKLSVGGKDLMPLQAYPFAKMYAWVSDKYGVSWQLMFREGAPVAQKLTPGFMFVGSVWGRAEEALEFYTKVFKNASVIYRMPNDGTEPPEAAHTVKYASIVLEGEPFSLMDGSKEAPFSFEQAISFMVSCETQDEVDYYWAALTEGGKEVQCGWLADRFGMPWQIVPTAFTRMMSTGTKEQIMRVTAAFMKMKKFDIATLERAFAGK